MAATYEKLIDDISKLTAIELSELVKALEEKFGVSAAMPVAAAGAPVAGGVPAGAAQSEEKLEYKVTLKEGGSDKIKVIKALRQVTTLGLTEAKKAVEEAPTVIGESVAKDKAKEMKTVLEAAGAKVELA